MNLHTASSLAVLSLAVALCLVPPPSTIACAPAPRHGEAVQLAQESAIIIWDAKSKTQHFIRRATFTSAAKDFGFLVPTPKEPELAEASDDAFTTLAKLTEPKVVKKPRPSGGGGCGGCGGARKSAAPASGVDVLGEQTVGAYKAAKLKADDADALGKWLTEHGYDFSPEIEEWVKPYIAKKWVISAFKIAQDDAKKDKAATDTARSTTKDTAPTPPGVISTTAVRMTFSTDQPYFPYREPSVKRGTGRRMLRIYFVGEDRVQGTLSDTGQDWSNATDTHVVWANKVQDADRDKVLELLKLPKETAPASWWLTEFEDLSGATGGGRELFARRQPERRGAAADHRIRLDQLDRWRDVLCGGAVPVPAALRPALAPPHTRLAPTLLERLGQMCGSGFRS